MINNCESQEIEVLIYLFSDKYKSDFNYLNINNFNPKNIDIAITLIIGFLVSQYGITMV